MFSRIAPVFSLSLFALFLSPFSNAASADDKSYDLTATATIATDYTFRGVSQTMEDPTVQAGFEFAHDSGFSAGIWSSNVDFQDRGIADDQADQEIDVYMSYGAEINNDWSVDGTFVRYIYPGTADEAELDWNELLASVNYRDRASFLIAYSNDVFNVEETGIYYGLSGNLPLPQNFTLTASVGYYDIEDAVDDSYVDWSIGAEYEMGIFTTRLAYVDTNDAGEDLYGDNAGGRAVLSVTAAFGN